MVNLKQLYIDSAMNEDSFKKNLNTIMKNIAKRDKEFISKSILAIQNIMRDENMDARPKYFLLQIVNLGCQMNVPEFYEMLAEKFLEKLYLLASHDKKNPNFEQRGKSIFKDINPDSNEEHSLMFYTLLIEMFSYWSEDVLAAEFEDFYSKYRVLEKAGIKFPSNPKYLHKYSNLISEYKQKTPSKTETAKQNQQKANVTGSVGLTEDELDRIFDELYKLRNLLQEHFDKQRSATTEFDECFAFMAEQLEYLDKFADNVSSNREYLVCKKYLEAFKESHGDYRETKKKLHKVEDSKLLANG